MALISNRLSLNEVGDRVKLIRDPGYGSERILLEINVHRNADVASALEELLNLDELYEQEKLRTALWIGYFYAHSVRTLPHDNHHDKGKPRMSDQTAPFNAEKMKADVSVVLVTEYDMTLEEAYDAVEKHHAEDPDSWHENADVKQLAQVLATLDDDV